MSLLGIKLSIRRPQLLLAALLLSRELSSHKTPTSKFYISFFGKVFISSVIIYLYHIAESLQGKQFLRMAPTSMYDRSAPLSRN